MQGMEGNGGHLKTPSAFAGNQELKKQKKVSEHFILNLNKTCVFFFFIYTKPFSRSEKKKGARTYVVDKKLQKREIYKQCNDVFGGQGLE